MTAPARFRCERRFEQQAWRQGYARVAGVDEVGRGCLCGPVYAGAVILPENEPIRGLRDSKELSPERREALAEVIRARAQAWSVAWVEAERIDEINILQASRLAMKMAVEALSPSADYLLVDACTLDVAQPQKAIVKGDARSQSIAAASILAKVARDERMREWDRIYPGYGLARHKGYGTAEHLAALQQYGLTPIHRRSYAPVRAVLQRVGE